MPLPNILFLRKCIKLKKQNTLKMLLFVEDKRETLRIQAIVKLQKVVKVAAEEKR